MLGLVPKSSAIDYFSSNRYPPGLYTYITLLTYRYANEAYIGSGINEGLKETYWKWGNLIRGIKNQ
jgi:hypothetical protein